MVHFQPGSALAPLGFTGSSGICSSKGWAPFLIWSSRTGPSSFLVCGSLHLLPVALLWVFSSRLKLEIENREGPSWLPEPEAFTHLSLFLLETDLPFSWTHLPSYWFDPPSLPTPTT